MTEMRERIARAIYTSTSIKNGGSTHGKYDELYPVVKEAVDRMADAALKAMLEPTDETVALITKLSGHNRDHVTDIWRAMITAALGDTTDG